MTRLAMRVMAFLLFTLGLGLTLGVAQSTVNVSMTSELRFAPANVLINLGDTVLWTNVSREPHTATGEEPRPQGFNSGALPRSWLKPGETFQFTFTTPGVYPYFCVPHKALGMV